MAADDNDGGGGGLMMMMIVLVMSDIKRVLFCNDIIALGAVKVRRDDELTKPRCRLMLGVICLVAPAGAAAAE
jgi:hypothetical protein